MTDRPTVIILHESVLHSWFKDFGSLGSLAGLIYVNHQYGAGNWLVDAIGGVLLFSFLLVRGSAAVTKTYRFTREDLRRWALNEGSSSLREVGND